MEFERLTNLIFDEVVSKLENNEGVSVFSKKRAKFEGWLKVELCDSLLKYFQDATPERNRIDITFDDWAIELKTVNTSYRYKNVENKIRTITMNVQSVIADIEKLKTTNYTNKTVLFVVFPVNHDHKNWQIHLQRISASLREIKYKEFKFKDEIPGVVYFGLV